MYFGPESREFPCYTYFCYTYSLKIVGEAGSSQIHHTCAAPDFIADQFANRPTGSTTSALISLIHSVTQKLCQMPPG